MIYNSLTSAPSLNPEVTLLKFAYLLSGCFTQDSLGRIRLDVVRGFDKYRVVVYRRFNSTEISISAAKTTAKPITPTPKT